MIIIKTLNEDEVNQTAHHLLTVFSNYRIFAIEGQMGAGKTTLIKAFCQILQVSDIVSSPTFSIINVYDSPQGFVHHFDLYRLNNLEEFIATGALEYIESGNYCFIEWPEKVLSLLPPETIRIKIDIEDDDSRIYKTEKLSETKEPYF